MRIITTGLKRCISIYVVDEKEFGANHKYIIKETESKNGPAFPPTEILFQKGPINEYGKNGIQNEDLLAIVIDRLKCFQQTGYKCRENAIAITKLEESLMWLNKRTRDRLNRKDEGKSEI